MATIGNDHCSVSSAYMNKNAKTLMQQGMTEAQLARATAKGNWGVLKGQWDTLPDGHFLGEAEYVGGAHVKQYKFWKKGDKVFMTKIDPHFPSQTDIFKESFEAYLDSPKWNFKPSSPIGTNSKSVGAMSDQDVATLFVKTKDEIANAKGINIKGVNKQLDDEVFDAIAKEIGYTPAEVKAKVDAYKAAGNKLSVLKKKALPKTSPKPPAPKVHPAKADHTPDPLPKPMPEPHGVPLVATEETVEEVVAELVEALPEYLDEDVAKAYIKAKDQLASDIDNPWTLYTQNNQAFEDAIVNLMEKSYGIDLSPAQIQQQLAKYKADGNKISVLKKKMAKTGEYEPKADTLKAKKGDVSKTGKTSKTQAQKDIADAADAGYHPGDPYLFSSAEEQWVFDNLKNDLYAAMKGENVYAKIEAVQKKFIQSFPTSKGQPPSLLDILRAYDTKKSQALGIPNGAFYEKKAAEYASSPNGTAAIQAKKHAAELEANLPPLPADSGDYQILSTREAAGMQSNVEPWTPDQVSGLKYYTASNYREMNSHLRGKGGYISDQSRRAIKNAQAGMRPSPRKFLVHRGCDFQQFGLGSYEQALQLVGKRVQDKGFLSTSVGGNSAFSGSVQLVVEVPSGTMGSYVKSISHFSHENEYLIAAGTEYEVLGVTKTGYQTTIRVRAIPGSHTKGL